MRFLLYIMPLFYYIIGVINVLLKLLYAKFFSFYHGFCSFFVFLTLGLLCGNCFIHDFPYIVMRVKYPSRI